MLRIEISSKQDKSLMYRTAPAEADCEHLIAESCEIYYNDVKWFTYLTNVPMEDLRAAVLDLGKLPSLRRSSGVPSQSKTFGFMPRMPVLQKDYCFACSLHRDHPHAKDVLFRYAEKCSNLLAEHYPEKAALSRQACATVKPDWVMPGGCFTSGIINQDNPLQYHYDAGNFEGTWSVMAAFKHQTTGGHLLLPEYNLKLAIQDSSICIFDGQSELHGVSPVVKMTPDAYRYTVVFYSIEAMGRCGTPKEELRRAQISRTQTEMKRAGLRK